MATRFYFPSTGASAVNPSYMAWTGTANADRRAMVRTKINSAQTDKTCLALAGSTAEFVLNRQYVSEPISGDQTISGTFKGQVRCDQSSGNMNATLAVGIQIVSNDGTTQRGVLLAISASDNTAATPPEFVVEATVPTNRSFQDSAENFSLTLSSVAALNGDRIVIEIGIREVGTSTTRNSDMPFGDNGSDLGENQSDTAGDPWGEFSQTINFTAGGGFQAAWAAKANEVIQPGVVHA